jgi:hypothetical protein
MNLMKLSIALIISAACGPLAVTAQNIISFNCKDPQHKVALCVIARYGIGDPKADSLDVHYNRKSHFYIDLKILCLPRILVQLFKN